MEERKNQTKITHPRFVDESEMDEWATNIVEMQEKKERMYHYTTMDTFFKIMENVKEDYFTFHAGSVYTMNDRQEMKRGYECIKKYLPIVEKKLNVKKKEKLFDMVQNQEQNKDIIDHFGEWLINDDVSNFVVSFSSTPDILPMWALYGDNGNGVCLEFSPYAIKNYYETKNTDKHLSIDKCVYTDEEIEDLLLFKLEIIYKLFLKTNSNEERYNPKTKARYLATMCGLAGAFVKHSGFRYEEEIRMNVFRSKEEWKFMDTRHHHHSVFVEVPIPINSLTKVIVGPAANIEDVKNSMVMIMRSKGIHLEPIHSEIPYRIY